MMIEFTTEEREFLLRLLSQLQFTLEMRADYTVATSILEKLRPAEKEA